MRTCNNLNYKKNFRLVDHNDTRISILKKSGTTHFNPCMAEMLSVLANALVLSSSNPVYLLLVTCYHAASEKSQSQDKRPRSANR